MKYNKFLVTAAATDRKIIWQITLMQWCDQCMNPFHMHTFAESGEKEETQRHHMMNIPLEAVVNSISAQPPLYHTALKYSYPPN